jgi:hypothetical protein
MADSAIGVNGAREQCSVQDCSEKGRQRSTNTGTGPVFIVGTSWVVVGEESAKGSWV